VNYLLDTNVLSEFKRPRPDENVIEWARNVDEARTYVSAVTIGELRRGAALLPEGRRKRELDIWIRHALRSRFDGHILDVTPAVAEAWGELMADAKIRGVGLQPIDALIAATARVHDLALVTRNMKDFSNFDIDLVNPWLP
jgi:predicted nucleic acid-binding protein